MEALRQSHEQAIALATSRITADIERAMSLTDGAGGYMIPFQLDPTILSSSGGSVHPVRRIARQVTINGDVWNGVSPTGATAESIAEATEVADGSPTVTQPSIPAYKYDCFCPYSVEIGDDATNFKAEILGLWPTRSTSCTPQHLRLAPVRVSQPELSPHLPGTASVVYRDDDDGG
jgi:HK97 family phage major capsid protein